MPFRQLRGRKHHCTRRRSCSTCTESPSNRLDDVKGAAVGRIDCRDDCYGDRGRIPLADTLPPQGTLRKTMFDCRGATRCCKRSDITSREESSQEERRTLLQETTRKGDTQLESGRLSRRERSRRMRSDELGTRQTPTRSDTASSPSSY